MIEPDYIYIMHDDTPADQAKFTAETLRELGIFNYFFAWSGTSSNCNTIENVWPIMKDMISHRIRRCTTNIALHKAIQEEWDAIGPDEIAFMVNSLPERIDAVLAADGGHTRY